MHRSVTSIAACLVGVAATLLPPNVPRAAETVVAGRVTRVLDGDTLAIGRTVIRLQGLAAPERGEPFGDAATRALRALVSGREVRCVPDGTRSHGRVVALCRLAGLDVAAVLIRRGLARDCARYSRGRYAVDEEAAVDAGAIIRERYALPSYCHERRRRQS